MKHLVKLKKGSLHNVYDKEIINHANRSFEYIKYLNQIEDNRSRGIMVLNGS